MGKCEDNMVTSKMRQSNIELCRIVCMLLIIAHHSVVHGGALTASGVGGVNRVLAYLALPGGKIGFCTFVVISTWFLVDKEFQWKHFLNTWLQVFWFSVVFTLIAHFFGVSMGWRSWLSVLFPIAGNSHGFAATYLAFYLLVPFLSMIRQNVDKRQLAFLVALLFYYEVCTYIFQVIFDYHVIILSSELTLFVLIYFVSLYIKRYTKLSEKRFYNVKSSISLLLGAFVIWISVFVIYYHIIPKYNGTLIANVLAVLSNNETSILYILAGYIFFFFFFSLDVCTSTIINKTARRAFGVLLFHDHNFFREVLWKRFLHSADFYGSVLFGGWILGATIGIYLVGMMIDWGRECMIHSIISNHKYGTLLNTLQRKSHCENK